MKRPFARLFEVDGESVLCYADHVENSEGDQVWAIITQFISDKENIAKLETSYTVETELDTVLDHLFNKENDEQHEDAIRKTLKTLRSFEI
jgi:hypothetical protein